MPQTLPGLAYSHHELADRLVTVALAAGRIQMRYFQTDVAIATKSDASPVTAADQESEAIILAALQRLAPSIAVIAEEAMAAGVKPDIGQVFWLVDPLDGTREFISGRGEFTVNIALISDGVPVFGLVYAPAIHDFYVTTGPNTAVRGQVAPDSSALRTSDFAAQPIRARLGNRAGLTAIASRSHLTAGTEAFLASLNIADRRSAGSSLKFCLIAAGEADVYPRVGPTNEWDTAAGQAVLMAAGGRVTQFDGAPMLYGKADVNFRNPDYVAWGATA
jgi:3'(2'), 5'-bisphosphate nucleotidase